MKVFSNFDDYEKQLYVGETSQGIVVEWHGLELQEDDILERMQEKGYIEPQDFLFFDNLPSAYTVEGFLFVNLIEDCFINVASFGGTVVPP